ncbi:glycine zipper domain-containing protein [Chelatococcus asaccharovorans]|uniref:glycine zipper domain-containing protein n=1 Tax=Chelatococcus asaccharovorans TaxID=28210 RepID=UPI002264A2CA|nr:glycine zipper domain-containing protein [Chelatococcus asaccharovorans]
MSLVLATTSVATAQVSAVACDNYANNYAQQASRRGQLIGGAAAGSLVGLGIGALFAATGVGAAIGATVGLIGGGAIRQKREQEIYNAAYSDCMSGVRP